jgi:hypothetical protein
MLVILVLVTGLRLVTSFSVIVASASNPIEFNIEFIYSTDMLVANAISFNEAIHALAPSAPPERIFSKP